MRRQLLPRPLQSVNTIHSRRLFYRRESSDATPIPFLQSHRPTPPPPGFPPRPGPESPPAAWLDSRRGWLILPAPAERPLASKIRTAAETSASLLGLSRPCKERSSISKTSSGVLVVTIGIGVNWHSGSLRAKRRHHAGESAWGVSCHRFSSDSRNWLAPNSTSICWVCKYSADVTLSPPDILGLLSTAAAGAGPGVEKKIEPRPVRPAQRQPDKRPALRASRRRGSWLHKSFFLGAATQDGVRMALQVVDQSLQALDRVLKLAQGLRRLGRQSRRASQQHAQFLGAGVQVDPEGGKLVAITSVSAPNSARLVSRLSAAPSTLVNELEASPDQMGERDLDLVLVGLRKSFNWWPASWIESKAFETLKTSRLVALSSRSRVTDPISLVIPSLLNNSSTFSITLAMVDCRAGIQSRCRSTSGIPNTSISGYVPPLSGSTSTWNSTYNFRLTMPEMPSWAEISLSGACPQTIGLLC